MFVLPHWLYRHYANRAPLFFSKSAFVANFDCTKDDLMLVFSGEKEKREKKIGWCKYTHQI
jgi:hypothetical protein